MAVESIVEPNLRNLQKTVTDFNPNTAGTTGTATVTLAFSNSGDGIAYDAHLTDSLTGGTNYALSAVVIDGTSYAPAACRPVSRYRQRGASQPTFPQWRSVAASS